MVIVFIMRHSLFHKLHILILVAYANIIASENLVQSKL